MRPAKLTASAVQKLRSSSGKKQWAITPGQSAVVYEKQCLPGRRHHYRRNLKNNYQQVGGTMAYILKNSQGEVIAVSAAENPGKDWIYAEDNSQEYLDFLEKIAG